MHIQEQSNTQAKMSEPEPLICITVKGTLLPVLFDAVKSCKGKTVIGFAEHETSFIGAEYSGEEKDGNQTLGMSFVLTKHSCESYLVNAPLKRYVKMEDIIRITSAKIFKNKNASKDATITILVSDAASQKMQFCIREANGIVMTQTISCSEATTMPFQYDDTFNLQSSRVIEASHLSSALNMLANGDHRYCTIELKADMVYFDGHGDGKQFVKANDCRIQMKVMQDDKVDEEPPYHAKGTYRVSDLQRFVKSSLKKAYIYLENNKPLLVEYLLDTKEFKDDTGLCDRCSELDLYNSKHAAQSVIRYIIAGEDNDDV